jgi:hypothetical protein
LWTAGNLRFKLGLILSRRADPLQVLQIAAGTDDLHASFYLRHWRKAGKKNTPMA